jgi:hypothetical protein
MVLLQVFACQRATGANAALPMPRSDRMFHAPVALITFGITRTEKHNHPLGNLRDLGEIVSKQNLASSETADLNKTAQRASAFDGALF